MRNCSVFRSDEGNIKVQPQGSTSRFKHLLEVGRVFLTETDSHGRYRGICDRASASAMHRENCQSVDQTATLFTTNSATI